MTPEELTMHTSVLTEEILDNLYLTIANYMEDVLKHDPYMDGFSEQHDALFFECVKQIGNIKIE